MHLLLQQPEPDDYVVLGWRPIYSFDDLVAEMVDADLKVVAQLNAESSMAKELMTNVETG
jgi:hypothetical protein